MQHWFSASTLFRRLVGPVIGLLLAAVLANIAAAAWLAARRSSAEAVTMEQQVTGVLASSQVPFAPSVLTAIHQLTRCHFVITDPLATTGVWTTLATEDANRQPWQELLNGTTSPPAIIQLPTGRFRVSLVRRTRTRPQSAVLLIPLPSMTRVTLEAVAPVLVVAGLTLATLIPLGLLVTGRLTRRVVAIEGLVGRIAAGAFGSRLPDEADALGNDRHDEIDRLRTGVNQMSSTLASLRESLVAGERQRLLGQLAAGFAHELRNAITGSRLAIDLHRRRCPLTGPTAAASDGSLAVAIRQLDILEEEVRGLLALGRPAERPPVSRVDLARLLADVHELVGPRLEHAGVACSCSSPPLRLAARREPLRAAVVNLALNAIDAAGPGGSIRLAAEREGDICRIAVEDNGPGIPADVADSIADPFVTAKPEGVGLGLAVARAVAEERGGGLNWSHREGITRFELWFPETRTADSPNRMPAEGTPG